MIIENSGLNGVKCELNPLDRIMEELDFVRWQWEYYRATYDNKIEDPGNNETYYLRINCRAVEGKLESPQALMHIEHVYIGRATYPHGLEYKSPIPESVMNVAQQRISELKQQLS